ncbi:MAG TPA: putative quinol monooxygenase [Anaeromyxobacteraceae bacterium]|nr:putative quinol monooxygenase [Anaeromyxobacteraceae bacterium]
MNSDSVVVLISYRAQPGREDAATRDLAALIATVRSIEPDCLGITMLRDPSDPTRLLLHELWTSREAYLGPHMQTPHLRAFRERAGAYFTGPPEIAFWYAVAAV